MGIEEMIDMGKQVEMRDGGTARSWIGPSPSIGIEFDYIWSGADVDNMDGKLQTRRRWLWHLLRGHQAQAIRALTLNPSRDFIEGRKARWMKFDDEGNEEGRLIDRRWDKC